jgi:hypothetical protein
MPCDLSRYYNHTCCGTAHLHCPCVLACKATSCVKGRTVWEPGCQQALDLAANRRVVGLPDAWLLTSARAAPRCCRCATTRPARTPTSRT